MNYLLWFSGMNVGFALEAALDTRWSSLLAYSAIAGICAWKWRSAQR